MDPDRLTVTRWRRFGHDRLYVSFDGAQVGWWDLSSGVPHPHTPYFLPALYTARANWQSSDPVLPMEADPSQTPVTAPTPDRDLAAREPAAALVAHAAALEQAAVRPAAPEDVAPTRPSAWRRFVAWLLGTDVVKAGPTAPAGPSRSWLVGVAGERQVAEILLSLTRSDPLWQTIHSVPVGTRGSDIDHIVLGPGGIFTVNTKHHPGGKVWVGGDVTLVNGVARPYVRNSRHEAARAARLLSQACGFPVPVRGLVVTVGATLSVKTAPAAVTVLEAQALSQWLRHQPKTLSVSTLDHVYAAARRESTWTRPQT